MSSDLSPGPLAAQLHALHLHALDPVLPAVSERMVEAVSMLALLGVSTSEDTVGPSWLQALKDPQLMVALSALHQGPNRAFLVEDLARLCGMSRSAFALRFRALVGTPPSRYLAQLRIDRCQVLLDESDLSLEQVATAVGYSCAAALSHAFKRAKGHAPGRQRRSRRP